MNQSNLRKLTAALALAGLYSVAQASGSLVLAPVNTSASPGDIFSLQVRGESFTDFVVGGGFNLSFDAASLRLDSVVINTAVWEFAPGGGVIDNASGTLSDAVFNTFAAVQPTGNFLAATLNFTATGAGDSVVALQASPFFPFANANAEVIAVSFGSANLSVSAVPEPSTWASLALGLALLPMLRRRLGRP